MYPECCTLKVHKKIVIELAKLKHSAEWKCLLKSSLPILCLHYQTLINFIIINSSRVIFASFCSFKAKFLGDCSFFLSIHLLYLSSPDFNTLEGLLQQDKFHYAYWNSFGALHSSLSLKFFSPPP